jgi:hypothetical protein
VEVSLFGKNVKGNGVDLEPARRAKMAFKTEYKKNYMLSKEQEDILS